MEHTVELGDEVQDRISGFKGVSVSFHDYLNGCRRITVQPRVDKEGKLPDAATFDEPDLEVTKAAKQPAPEREPVPVTGGPSKYEDAGRAEDTGRR